MQYNAARKCVQEGLMTRQRPAQRAELMYRIGKEIRNLLMKGRIYCVVKTANP